jgi:hypothetical protein
MFRTLSPDRANGSMPRISMPQKGSNWNWYLPRAREIFVDLDSGKKWRCFVRSQALPGVETVDIAPSTSAGHYHVRVVLAREIGEAERLALALHLGTDPLGAQHAMMRLARGVQPITLLVTPGNLGRDPDDRCSCEAKHDSLAAMRGCPVGRVYRGTAVSEWYGHTPWDVSPWE